MSAAVHAEDHQGGDDAPAEVTAMVRDISPMNAYEAYLFSQYLMHDRMAKETKRLLLQSVAERNAGTGQHDDGNPIT